MNLFTHLNQREFQSFLCLPVNAAHLTDAKLLFLHIGDALAVAADLHPQAFRGQTELQVLEKMSVSPFNSATIMSAGLASLKLICTL